MVIGKISSLATLVFVFAMGIIFLRQAYGSSIGTAGVDVGAGLTGTASGVTSLINSFLSPITSLIGTFSSFFGSVANGSRQEPSNQGRDERAVPDKKIKSGDAYASGTSTIRWDSGSVATVPSLSSEARAYYSALGVSVT